MINDLRQLPDNCQLVTMDVGSLYTNIPIDDGLEACRIALNTYRSATNIKTKTEILVKLLENCLEEKQFPV